MIAAAFPGMFTWPELLDMGVRQRSYWIWQAESIRRQTIAAIAHAVSIGMADSEDRQRAIDDLELSETREESRKKRSQATWNMLYAIGGGKSV